MYLCQCECRLNPGYNMSRMERVWDYCRRSLQARSPSCQPTNIKASKEYINT